MAQLSVSGFLSWLVMRIKDMGVACYDSIHDANQGNKIGEISALVPNSNKKRQRPGE